MPCICGNVYIIVVILQTERARHLLQVREKVREREQILQGHSQQELTLSDETKEELAKKVPYKIFACSNYVYVTQLVRKFVNKEKSTPRKEERSKGDIDNCLFFDHSLLP